MIIKRISAALLLCAMLLSVAVSCGGKDENSPDGSDKPAGEETAEATVSEESTIEPLEVRDLGGKDFRVLVYKQGDPGTWFQYLDFEWTEEAAGDLINDNIMNRNIAIEEKYNIRIVSNQVSDVVSTARKAITAGSDEFEILEPYCDSAYSMAGEGLLYNIYDLPYCEFDMPWWDSNIQRDLSLQNRLWTVTGDISMFDEELSYVVYYNQVLAKQYEIEDCYELARSGKWTIDKMAELGRIVTHDLNGDGVLGDEDVYGVVTDYGVGRSWFYAMGAQLCKLESDGTPKLVVGEPHSQAAFDKISALMNDETSTKLVSKLKNSWTAAINGMKEDRVLFLPGSLYDITGYRSMENDFGVLPYPKHSEEQERYYNYVASHVCPVISVPVTNSDIESTGLLLEALSRESSDTIVNAYIELNLMTKVARDDSSAEMMRLIFATKRYDLACSYNWGKITNVIEPSCRDSSKFQSTLAKLLPAAEADMAKTLEQFAG